MRALLMTTLALLAACGADAPDAKKSYALGDRLFRTVRIINNAGRVDVRTAVGEPKIAVKAFLREGQEGEWGDGPATGVEKDTLVINDDPRFTIHWTITVSPGLALNIVGKDTEVRVAGDWASVDIRNQRGRIDIDAVHIGGGKVNSLAGAIDLRVLRPPTRDLACESKAGDVSLTLPSTYRGSFHLASEQGATEVEPHPSLWKRQAGTAAVANGFVGKKPNLKEYREMHEDGIAPPGVWGRTRAGRATFRLRD